MTTLLEAVTNECDTAQVELAQAEIAAIEATARAEHARSEYAKLVAAVAALTEEAPAEPSAHIKVEVETPAQAEALDRSVTSDMTEEEFDAYRRQRQKKRRKELDADNPLAQYACGGCGAVGTSTEQIITAPSGSPVRLIGCSACGNQTF